MGFPWGVASFEPHRRRGAAVDQAAPRPDRGPVGARPRSRLPRGGRRRRRATDADRDRTVCVDATGLAPGTTYWYRFEAGGELVAGRAHPDPAGGAGRAGSASATSAAPATRWRRSACTGPWPSGRSTSSSTSATTSTRTTRSGAPAATGRPAPAVTLDDYRAAAGPGAGGPGLPGAPPAPPDDGHLGRPRLRRQRLAGRRQAPRRRRATGRGRPGSRPRPGPARSGCRRACPTPTDRLRHLALGRGRRPGRAGAARHPHRRARPASRATTAPCPGTTRGGRSWATTSGPGSASGWPTSAVRGRSCTAGWSSASCRCGCRRCRGSTRSCPTATRSSTARLLHDDQWDGYPAEQARVARWMRDRGRRAGRRWSCRATSTRRGRSTARPIPTSTADDAAAGGGGDDRAGDHVGPHGPHPSARAVAGGRPLRPPPAPRAMGRDHRAGLRRSSSSPPTGRWRSGGSSTPSPAIRPPPPSWGRPSRPNGRPARPAGRRRHRRPTPPVPACRRRCRPGRPT